MEFTPSEMLEFISSIQQTAAVRPRTYWCEFPFYIVINDFRKHFCFGYRPEDLAHLDTIDQKAWKKHKAHVNRLDRFPLDKAEYFLRLKETHGVNSARGLAKLVGENWSYVAKMLKLFKLPEPVKDFVRNNKSNPAIIKFFNLRRLLEIVRQDDEKLQMACFSAFMEEFNGRGENIDRG